MEYHLVVLVHGLWGNTSHFDYIKSQLESNESLHKSSKETIVVYRTGSNEGYKTYDGIDLCGGRVAFEIEREIELLNSKGNVTKFSILGYSLGGLIARYAIGLLYYKDVFKNIELINFTSFCCPHVGVLAPGTGMAVKFFNWLVPILLANSGKQMFLRDRVKTTKFSIPEGSRNSSSTDLKSLGTEITLEQPLLLLMASPNSVFYKALSSFKHHVLYSNVVNDKRTSWWSAGISMMNPFEVLDTNPNVMIDEDGVINFENGSKFELHFVKNYEPTVLDVNSPIKLQKDLAVIELKQTVNPLKGNVAPAGRRRGVGVEQQNNALPSGNFFQRKFKWVNFLLNFLVYAPVWVIWFIGNNLIQRVNSGLRVLRESDRSDVLNELYSFSVEDEHTVTDVPQEVEASIEAEMLITDEKRKRRPSLTRKLSETYEDLGKNIEANIHDHTDGLLESMWDAMTSKPAGEPTLFEQEHLLTPQQSAKIPPEDIVTITTTLEKLSKHEFKPQAEVETKISSPPKEDLEELVLKPFQLALSEEQLAIIHNLNQLKWRKFPIYITGTMATHAAAIVRHRDENFAEGEVVVRHWIDEEFRRD
ncbi:unnamed protein product [Kuraishia capsulata CBS 1993]|uniref:DUF676 domain-containing protein n=1 Tax=Kuraishia capsulata CBS 1993 TaxID=1382522 RepID=W6MF43_9ASCO|nr:uncharacterized protein KUCA_T00000199001 [Kuraishia capsulata CBS 1993]CDK24239.1 unnamed protein product [Kuraishia capsulata CBS 1993]